MVRRLDPDDAARAELVDALLAVSRAMVALAARSLATLDADVTLQQYRALVVLATFGPQPSAEVARQLAVAPSTMTRMCDRLVRKSLIQRFHRDSDRRQVWLGLTVEGRDLVGEAMQARREEIDRLVREAGLVASGRTVKLLESLTTAAGEIPEPDWRVALDKSAEPVADSWPAGPPAPAAAAKRARRPGTVAPTGRR